MSMANHSPVDTRQIHDHVNHVATQLVALHIHRRTIGGYVDLGHHIEQERLLNTRIRYQYVQQVFQGG